MDKLINKLFWCFNEDCNSFEDLTAVGRTGLPCFLSRYYLERTKATARSSFTFQAPPCHPGRWPPNLHITFFIFFPRVQVLQFPLLISIQAWETPSLGKWHLQPDLSTLSAVAPSSLWHPVFIFSPFLPSKVPNSSAPSIKMSGYITHMIKIKANNSPCILSYIVSHLAGPGTQPSLNKAKSKTSVTTLSSRSSAKIRLWIWQKTQPNQINILNAHWFSICLLSFTLKV